MLPYLVVLDILHKQTTFDCVKLTSFLRRKLIPLFC